MYHESFGADSPVADSLAISIVKGRTRESFAKPPLSDSVSSYCFISCSITILTPLNVVHADISLAVGVVVLSVAAGATQVRRFRQLKSSIGAARHATECLWILDGIHDALDTRFIRRPFCI